MLDNLRKDLRGAIDKIVKSNNVDKETIIALKKDVQRSLIMSDVEAGLVVNVTSRLQQRALDETPPPGLSRKDHVVKILYEEISSLLGDEYTLDVPKDKTMRILLLGIQGSGKTTTCAKLAKILHDKDISVGVIGADNYRPGALAQLKTMCDKSKTEVYGDGANKNADDIVQKGLDHFKDACNVILIDTAGRHRREDELLDEMKSISKVARPDLVILVIDGTVGQQCFAQSKTFHEMVPVGGIIVTKLDGSGKGGGALAAAAATGARIMFISNGERVDDLIPFSPTRFVGRMLDMGDIQAILDLAKRLEAVTDEGRAKRIYRGRMSLIDFLDEMENMAGTGSLKNVLESLPMFAGQLSEKRVNDISSNIEKWRYMIQSMTEEEQMNPDMINRSRIRRIARGSGCTERDVKDLIKSYNSTKTLIKSNKGRKMPDMLRRMGLG
ncbi:MAG: signal recognition particle protein [Cenarchaeum sp. SB0665_bin_23]|nr:signal recognition particle protein [Cenarchaeum sp. SB0667_bin_13]MXY61282.1 signal recognition particle protein [Cenarchaeum sp. SB0665_bin_23]MXZ93119.1 signal recognition particle protein [Cenarchaeum sp. SB0666_bin_15]MYB47503.1 signal recognition particle protein [Cenarchaeum sp. SB0662_bin_33]MYC79068.1 signal recognition particle protein [Cenarchaeum sp. SB0661_bin_35]MYD58591.1 signal recognition particle protein [Cenarchaeum sp. SB0678_bin_8]MYG32764.1 signal recognition particle